MTLSHLVELVELVQHQATGNGTCDMPHATQTCPAACCFVESRMRHSR